MVGGACLVAGGACIGYDEIRSMSGRYASYWNAFLFIIKYAFSLFLVTFSSKIETYICRYIATYSFFYKQKDLGHFTNAKNPFYKGKIKDVTIPIVTILINEVDNF